MAARRACEPWHVLLFIFARAAHEFRQLRSKVGEEPQERSPILNLGLGFVGGEISVDLLESGFCWREACLSHYGSEEFLLEFLSREPTGWFVVERVTSNMEFGTSACRPLFGHAFS
jgi:hypothetical protein